MARKAVWAIGCTTALALGLVFLGAQGSIVQSAEHEMPQFVVGDTYAFVGLEPGVVSGVVVSAGPYPWVEVKVDNAEANVYFINLDRVARFKHMK